MPRQYYVPGEFTIGLESVARYAARLAGRRKDVLVHDVARWLGTGDDHALDALLVLVRQYTRCFRDVGRERRFNVSDVARIHVMAACDLLADSLLRVEVTKALVRKTACDLWTRACQLHVGTVPTLRDFERVRWRRIYADLGLSDLREAHRKNRRALSD